MDASIAKYVAICFVWLGYSLVVYSAARFGKRDMSNEVRPIMPAISIGAIASTISTFFITFFG